MMAARAAGPWPAASHPAPISSARLSVEMMPGPTGFASAPTACRPLPWPVVDTATTSRGSVPPASRAPRTARQAERQNSSGSTSVWPGAGNSTSLAWRALTTSVPSSANSAALAIVPPVSIPRMRRVSTAFLPVDAGTGLAGAAQPVQTFVRNGINT